MEKGKNQTQKGQPWLSKITNVNTKQCLTAKSIGTIADMIMMLKEEAAILHSPISIMEYVLIVMVKLMTMIEPMTMMMLV
tara:strand:+ start:531 stop:770 length:240 start_codon:yes stop_codon:yes gene_type:complete